MKKLVFTAFAVGLGLTAGVMAQVPNYVPTNGLVGWWPFNGNANDESGNGNNGTVNGATLTVDRFGNTGKAYSFDGVDDRIEIAHNSNLDLSSVSISCWINPTALLTPSGYGPTILSKREASGWGASFQMNIGNNAFWADWTIGSNNGIYYTDSSNLQINIDTYAHLIYTHDASFVRLYLNGVIVEELPSPGLLSFNSLPLWFGGRPNAGGNSQYFQGTIDDIGIWNRALTDQEITDLYNANICYEYVTVTDTLVINTGITGYNPITYLNTLKIWPNPSNDHITIDAGNLATMNGYSIKIEDAQGQQVFQNAVNQQQFYIDITSWGGNGLYFVRIIDPQGNTVDIKKIVLQ